MGRYREICALVEGSRGQLQARDIAAPNSNPSPSPNPNPSRNPNPSPNPNHNPNPNPIPNPSPDPNPDPDQAAARLVPLPAISPTRCAPGGGSAGQLAPGGGSAGQLGLRVGIPALPSRPASRS